MNRYIAIDGGTTKTKISLLEKDRIIYTTKENVGVKNGKEMLEHTITENILKIEAEYGKTDKIIASGMLTSKNGLYEVPYILAPAGLTELHCAAKEVKMFGFDFVFIPGVKKEAPCIEDVDIMRGEETELMGLTAQIEKECAYILPGSHSKCILTDKYGRICDFSTYFTGEMISALISETILKYSLCYCDADESFLKYGFDMCEKYGVNQSLFKTRIFDIIENLEKEKLFGYFLGVIMHDEVKKIAQSNVKKIIVGGKKELRHPETVLLKDCLKKNVCELDDRACENAPAFGAVKIYEGEI